MAETTKMLARRMRHRLRRNGLVMGEVWASAPAELPNDVVRQMILFFSAAASYPKGVYSALVVGASGYDPLPQVRALTTPNYALLVRQISTAFWWRDPDRDEPVVRPIEAAIAGRSPGCIRHLLDGDGKNFRMGFGWLVALRPNVYRVDAGLATVAATRGMPEERKYREAIISWLDAAEYWLNNQEPETFDHKTLTVLHGRMTRQLRRFDMRHQMPLSHELYLGSGAGKS